MKIKPQLVLVKCERCGKTLTTLRRALHNLDKLKKEFPVLCEACATEQEKYEIIHAIGAAIARREQV